jgi:hypothetical protein
MARFLTSSATTANQAPAFPGPGLLHRRVQGQQVRLEGDLVNGLDNLGGLFAGGKIRKKLVLTIIDFPVIRIFMK